MAAVKTHDTSLMHTTRKLLDELDDLMDRMLALPVDVEEPEPVYEAPRGPALAASLTLLEPARSEAFAARTYTPEPAPISNQVPPPSRLGQVDAILDDVPEPERALALWLLRPLWWCNEAFDDFTSVLGAPGCWLRGVGGRGILGYTGVALLILSAACLAKDLLGWTW